MSNLEADILWYQAQIAACEGALAALADEPESLSRDVERRVQMESLGRYQATLEHLQRLRAMNERSSSAAKPEER